MHDTMRFVEVCESTEDGFCNLAEDVHTDGTEVAGDGVE
jgi:hypothetical protein